MCSSLIATHDLRHTEFSANSVSSIDGKLLLQVYLIYETCLYIKSRFLVSRTVLCLHSVSELLSSQTNIVSDYRVNAEETKLNTCSFLVDLC